MTIETVVFNADPLWLIMISTSLLMASGEANCLVKEFGPMEISVSYTHLDVYKRQEN